MTSVNVSQGQPGQPGYGGYPGYPPPQQQQQQQVVVINQPGSQKDQGQPQNIREWSTGLCGCFEDCCSCMYAYFCFPCFMCTLAGSMNECACGPFCFDRVFTTAMRTKVRTMYGIRGSILNDCCCILCCQFCSVLQMHRELKNMGRIIM